MKKLVSFILFTAMSFGLCLSFASCGNTTGVGNGNNSTQNGGTNKNDNEDWTLFGGDDEDKKELTYGKKYALKSKTIYDAFIFNKDGTGTYEFSRSYVGQSKKSGTIAFLWEETSDGAIHLLSTEVTYNEGATEDETMTLPSTRLYFSENMLYYSSSLTLGSGVSTYYYRYYLEGSKLYEQFYDED